MNEFDRIEEEMIEEGKLVPHLNKKPKITNCDWGEHIGTCFPVICSVFGSNVWYCDSCIELSQMCREAIDK